MKKFTLLLFLISFITISSQAQHNLDVEGSVKIVNGTEGDGKVLTSDANGVATWQTPSGGGSSLWTSDTDGQFYNSGNIGIGSNSTTKNNLYIYREEGVTGADTSTIFAYRYGANGATNGGSSWGVTGVDSAIKGYSYYGNAYSAGISAYSYLDFSNSTAFVAAGHDGSNAAHLAYRDAQSKFWSGHFDGDMYISGNVGIGETNPANKLTVKGSTTGEHVIYGEYTGPQSTNIAGVYGQNDAYDFSGYGVRGIGGLYGVRGEVNPTGSDFYFGVSGTVDGGTGVNYGVFGSASGSGRNYAVYASGDLKVTSQVFIGTNAAQQDAASSYELVVDGKAIVEELVVELSGDWPDYVFEEAYDLAPLSEVQSFIDENGHLPNVPSAATLEAGDGIAVGEMQRLLMEKVEELTLYTIDQENRVKALEAQNVLLKQLINDLQD